MITIPKISLFSKNTQNIASSSSNPFAKDITTNLLGKKMLTADIFETSSKSNINDRVANTIKNVVEFGKSVKENVQKLWHKAQTTTLKDTFVAVKSAIKKEIDLRNPNSVLSLQQKNVSDLRTIMENEMGMKPVVA